MPSKIWIKSQISWLNVVGLVSLAYAGSVARRKRHECEFVGVLELNTDSLLRDTIRAGFIQHATSFPNGTTTNSLLQDASLATLGRLFIFGDASLLLCFLLKRLVAIVKCLCHKITKILWQLRRLHKGRTATSILSRPGSHCSPSFILLNDSVSTASSTCCDGGIRQWERWCRGRQECGCRQRNCLIGRWRDHSG